MFYSRKFRYSMHVERLIKSRHVIDSNKPHMYNKLPAAKFYGIGPKQSLDQKLNFINENNCLARRIISVGKRKDCISGLE